MSVSLSKGSKVSLSKEAQNLGIKLESVNVGLGWDACRRGEHDYDLDAWALVITDQGLSKKNLVYFSNTYDSSSQIHHCGDNLTGDRDGDDEVITINLKDLPNNYKSILVGVTIFRATARKQSFKYVDNAFIRLYDQKSGTEICKYSSDKFKNEVGGCTLLLFGVLNKINGVWEFNTVGRGDNFDSITDALNIYNNYELNYDTKLEI